MSLNVINGESKASMSLFTGYSVTRYLGLFQNIKIFCHVTNDLFNSRAILVNVTVSINEVKNDECMLFNELSN